MAVKIAKYSGLNERGFWTDAAELECVMILDEGPQVMTFVFKTDGDSWFRYKPGQFITIEIPTTPEPTLRTYTLSSSPSRPLSINVTIKAQPDSVGSRWLFDNLKEGDKLRAFGPGGIFTFMNYSAEKYLFIAAGSGITPMISMTRWLYDNGERPDITVINCARRPSEIIFAEEFRRMAQRVPEIKLGYVVEEDDDFAAWAGFRGRLNQIMMELIAPDYFEREVFCCGPEPFMRGVRDILNAAGFDMEHYHEESFQAPIRTEDEIPEYEEPTPDESLAAEIRFARADRAVACVQTDTVLEVARAHGLAIPSACQFGVCGTCKVRKLGGEVNMVHNGGISDAEVAEGYILACCSRPIGSVSVDL